MSNKVLVGTVVLLLAGGAYWLYTDSQKENAKGADTTTPTSQIETTRDSQAKMSPEAGRTVGKWKSTEDAKFTREFREDGTVTDMYEGNASATANGTWSQVIDVAVEPVQLPAVGGATLLKLILNGEAFYFAISTDTTADKLVLINLGGRGNILSFTRVQ